MKKSFPDNLFEPDFKDEIQEKSLSEIKAGKYDQSTMLALLIGYVLKFKRIEQAALPSSDAHAIREKVLQSFILSKRGKYLQVNFRSISVAASILLIFTLGAYLLGTKEMPEFGKQQRHVIEFSTPKGQQSELTLPDGTFVALNYDSKLKYHVSSHRKLQEVELDGEAFFHVSKNKSRTFRVITKEMDVNVLGTQFDVRAYQEDEHTETTLLEGSVEIRNIQAHNESVLLKPGEKWQYDKAEQLYSVVPVDPEQSTTWRSGEYYFTNVSLSELSKTLERMYNVSIHFQDSSLENEVYSGSVYREDDLSKLFDLINLSVPIGVKRQGREIYLTRK